jgi:hypothetical protein
MATPPASGSGMAARSASSRTRRRNFSPAGLKRTTVFPSRFFTVSSSTNENQRKNSLCLASAMRCQWRWLRGRLKRRRSLNFAQSCFTVFFCPNGGIERVKLVPGEAHPLESCGRGERSREAAFKASPRSSGFPVNLPGQGPALGRRLYSRWRGVWQGLVAVSFSPRKTQKTRKGLKATGCYKGLRLIAQLHCIQLIQLFLSQTNPAWRPIRKMVLDRIEGLTGLKLSRV